VTGVDGVLFNDVGWDGKKGINCFQVPRVSLNQNCGDA